MTFRFKNFINSWTLACIGGVLGLAAGVAEWRSVVPAGQGDSLESRLDAYVKASRSRNWGKLYELVSDKGRGGVDRTAFAAKMKAAHGDEFASMPDLLAFRPERATGGAGEYDVYGCGKARREGREFNGIALTHAVLEHDKWFFTGWTFTEFPNEPCKELSDPAWKAPGAREWNLPMEELRDSAGVPFHVDGPKK